jgi:FkbM family methyltransferase
VIATVHAHGHTYEVAGAGDGVIGKALAAGSPYEARVLEHIKRRGFQGTAIDAGAHVGNHTLWLAIVCGLRVYAAEPLTHELLQANVERNGLTGRVTVWPHALGAERRTAGDIGKGRIRGEGTIPVVPLDEKEVRGRVAVMKVDVEGMEPDVLIGGMRRIERDRPVIYAEAWDNNARRSLADLLEPLGYTHVKTFGATPLLEWVP